MIKSKKAKEIIETHHRVVPCYSSQDNEWYDTEDTEAIEKGDAIMAIKAAESDARKRAVEVYKRTCLHYSMGCCIQQVGHDEWEHCECSERAGCKHLNNFLKHYDNE